MTKLPQLQDICKWLHELLENRPLAKYPFSINGLPKCGIYFFYEENEFWGHGGTTQRIVRIGTHRSQNFKSRINEHFLLNDKWMNFDSMKPAPKDRSIFRKNLGRALINRDNPEYLNVWNIDFMKRENKNNFSHLRDIEYE